MTELERQLTAALRKLSVQVEALRRQIEQLAGHVTGLDADYKTIAATLRES